MLPSRRCHRACCPACKLLGWAMNGQRTCHFGEPHVVVVLHMHVGQVSQMSQDRWTSCNGQGTALPGQQMVSATAFPLASSLDAVLVRRCMVNGAIVPLRCLREVAAELVDLNAQNVAQTLGWVPRQVPSLRQPADCSCELFSEALPNMPLPACRLVSLTWSLQTLLATWSASSCLCQNR